MITSINIIKIIEQLKIRVKTIKKVVAEQQFFHFFYNPPNENDVEIYTTINTLSTVL